VPKANGFAQILADKLEDLVVVLLLPLFFAYSGLRTEIGLLDTAHAWAICAVIIVAATAGKFGGSAIAARLTGLRWREASALGVLMNTRGLMELIVLNIGLDLGVITPTLFTMMVIMALVTTFMTTPILERIYPAAVAEAEPSEAEAALTAPGGFTALMCVAYDRSGPGMVTVAAALLGETDDRNRLYALRLLPPTGRASFVLAESQEERDTTALDPLLERADALGVTVRPIAFVSPQPAKDICQVAAVKRADLVLLGWHKPVLGRTVLSGTVHEVMRQSGTSVAVLVDRGLGWISRVLVPYRGGAHDRGAVELAARFAQHAGASVTVLHVVTLDPTKPDAVADGDPLATVVQPRSDNGGRIEVKVVDHSDPMHAVIEECETGYDLVVIGASAEWGLEHRSFGMQPEPIIRDCPASLLIVQHEAAVARAAAAGEEPAVPSVHRA
jgi:nucleotide-binding universal stress UspA family protein